MNWSVRSHLPKTAILVRSTYADPLHLKRPDHSSDECIHALSCLSIKVDPVPHQLTDGEIARLLISRSRADERYRGVLDQVLARFESVLREEILPLSSSVCDAGAAALLPEGIVYVPGVCDVLEAILKQVHALPALADPRVAELHLALSLDAARWLQHAHPGQLHFIVTRLGGPWATGPYRHCACCLVLLVAPKLCGGCKRRAYCWRACQRIDWTLSDHRMVSQGHKHWCRLGCGEEDVDWAVAAVPGQGFGLVAKTFVARGSRIFVDAGAERPHDVTSIVDDLVPIGGSVTDKFLRNAAEIGDGKAGLGMRLSRMNHACDPNAALVFDPTLRVKIVYDERDIAPGDAICISYTVFNGFFSGRRPSMPSPRRSRTIGALLATPTCAVAAVARSRLVDPMVDHWMRLRQFDAALAVVHELEALATTAHAPFMTWWSICDAGAKGCAALGR
ncbi:Aste57867_18392 [Aphanomyces stellatus]|uniref:Aste57867_18392 protein n=1 Tax=Aphanomyces stellatus TaxID=120398 RepID=A0A485LA81_9STRA|nr:hypothetical protein As57867_018330 [Aphanomyces stellatus]VFT95128.1 Aste57867_18392 [Aphanomyces stellatus]